jgi:hypothetical protein
VPLTGRSHTVQARFQILDVALTLVGPEGVVAPLALAYRRFASSAGAPAPRAVRIVLEDAGAALRVDGRSIPLVPEIDRLVQVQRHLQAALMDALGSHAVLHAAALVSEQGTAFLLAAPSGHGKSSLTLELVRRGRGLLSDDCAPLDLRTARVHPFPRAVAVRPDGSGPIPEPFATAARRDDAVRAFGKTLLDVGQIAGEEALVGDAVPLGHVFLLTPLAEAAVTRVRVAARARDAADYEARFRSAPGVEITGRREIGELRVWDLVLDHRHRPTEALAELFDGDRTVLFEKEWDAAPDFSAQPTAHPVRRREAAVLLGREMLNRRVGGALLARYAGSVAPLFLDLAGALRHASCWRVSVGGIRDTAGLIERLIVQAPRRPSNETSTDTTLRGGG